MQVLDKINIIRNYCDYVEEHIKNVSESWELLKTKCAHMRFIYDDFVFFTIDGMVRSHDMSKTSTNEFIQYAEWFFGPHGKEWESMDVEHENQHIRLHKEFDAAWEHHKKENPHHWQNWTNKESVCNPYELECHCVCMVVDWMAMGLKFGDTAEEYYEREKTRINLPEWSVRFIRDIFEAIKTGE